MIPNFKISKIQENLSGHIKDLQPVYAMNRDELIQTISDAGEGFQLSGVSPDIDKIKWELAYGGGKHFAYMSNVNLYRGNKLALKEDDRYRAFMKINDYRPLSLNLTEHYKKKELDEGPYFLFFADVDPNKLSKESKLSILQSGFVDYYQRLAESLK